MGEEVVRFLIQSNVNVNNASSRTKTALHCAAMYGHIEIMRMLFDAGAVITPEMSAFGTSYVPVKPELMQLVRQHGGKWPDPAELAKKHQQQKAAKYLSVIGGLLFFAFIYFIPDRSPRPSFNPTLANPTLGWLCFLTFFATIALIAVYFVRTHFHTRNSRWDLTGLFEGILAAIMAAVCLFLSMLQLLPILCVMGLLVIIGIGAYLQFGRREPLTRKIMWGLARNYMVYFVVLHLRVLIYKFV
eukprot:TRINITY_DN10198_c0_g2_i3.p1 TRINITY_DN10198_c0_g2~~TRINITY_DN10198_c0_g2_i3.p1  ORF type:complete len:254 (-),score=82.15 TRINITY_DN10198_c0_g2_i3:85-816(-)